MKDATKEKMNQIFEICMRLNIETEFAVWCEMIGHVSKLKVQVRASKENYEQKIHDESDLDYDFDRYYYGYMSDEDRQSTIEKNEKEFNEKADRLIETLNQILSKTWGHKFTAYCNLIDMSCSQVFADEDAAKRWVSNMKRKYKSVGPIVGYKSEKVEAH